MSFRTRQRDVYPSVYLVRADILIEILLLTKGACTEIPAVSRKTQKRKGSSTPPLSAAKHVKTETIVKIEDDDGTTARPKVAARLAAKKNKAKAKCAKEIALTKTAISEAKILISTIGSELGVTMTTTAQVNAACGKLEKRINCGSAMRNQIEPIEMTDSDIERDDTALGLLKELEACSSTLIRVKPLVEAMQEKGSALTRSPGFLLAQLTALRDLHDFKVPCKCVKVLLGRALDEELQANNMDGVVELLNESRGDLDEGMIGIRLPEDFQARAAHQTCLLNKALHHYADSKGIFQSDGAATSCWNKLKAFIDRCSALALDESYRQELANLNIILGAACVQTNGVAGVLEESGMEASPTDKLKKALTDVKAQDKHLLKLMRCSSMQLLCARAYKIIATNVMDNSINVRVSTIIAALDEKFNECKMSPCCDVGDVDATAAFNEMLTQARLLVQKIKNSYIELNQIKAKSSKATLDAIQGQLVKAYSYRSELYSKLRVISSKQFWHMLADLLKKPSCVWPDEASLEILKPMINAGPGPDDDEHHSTVATDRRSFYSKLKLAAAVDYKEVDIYGEDLSKLRSIGNEYSAISGADEDRFA